MNEKLVRFVGVVGFVLLALAVTESFGYAQQQDLSGNCLYQRGSNQLVGCYSSSGGRLWFVSATGAVLDVKSQVWFGTQPNGTLMVWTTQGWYPAQAHPQAMRVIREIAAANQQALQRGRTVQVGPGVTATPNPGGGTILSISPVFTARDYVQAQMDPRTAQMLQQSERAGIDVWLQRPPGPWYGR